MLLAAEVPVPAVEPFGMNDMKIAGLEKCSFVDYPGCLSAVVFTPGCNMNCFYCHNRQLIGRGAAPAGAGMPAGADAGFAGGAGAEPLTVASVMDLLERRRGMLDAVVVTGGEPTLQVGLEAFLAAVRAMGFRTKLDTNGTNPDVLKTLLDERLVDFVAMDVKAPTDLYEEICGKPVDQSAISRSIALLMDGGAAYEFRTTFAPPLTAEDILRIALRIRGARSYVLQQYRPQTDAAAQWDASLQGTGFAADRAAAPRCTTAPPPHSDAYIRAAAETLRPFVRHCSVRGIRQATALMPAHMPPVLAPNPARVAAPAPAQLAFADAQA
jgi:pyruvate formate lyase activating enzyme